MQGNNENMVVLDDIVIEKLAHDVLILSRNTLMLKMRFMDEAFCELQWQVTPFFHFATDMQTLWYNPLSVLRKYKNDRNVVARDYLHIVMHCIFRHPYIKTLINQACWNLACDIAVENSINGLNINAVDSNRAQKQVLTIKNLKNEVKMLTAEKLYRHFLNEKLSDKKIAELRELFCADDHEIWYIRKKDDGNSSGESSDSRDSDSYKHNGVMSLSRGESERRWKELSERIKIDMETFSKEHGDNSGGITQNLAEVTREKYDYGVFLKKFATLGEVMKVNDDEFDYVFYTYGLKLYGNVPLIEPLEYKEVKRIKEFVIAIDTSGSVSGELVQKFINKTYNILHESENFFTKINLHIIQCDTKIQQDVKITSREEFDKYLKTMTLHGFGGTDFRPVFEYTDKLLHNKEFTNLKGLIYFTDGYGIFPAKKPNYETAFVFIDDNYEIPEVPVWAIRLVLGREEV